MTVVEKGRIAGDMSGTLELAHMCRYALLDSPLRSMSVRSGSSGISAGGQSRGWRAEVALSCVSPRHGSFLRRSEGEWLAA